MENDTDKPRTPLARRLRQAREAAKLDRAEVADAVGCTVRSVYRYEARTEPSVERLAKFAEVLGVSLHWLATGTEPQRGAA